MFAIILIDHVCQVDCNNNTLSATREIHFIVAPKECMQDYSDHAFTECSILPAHAFTRTQRPVTGSTDLCAPHLAASSPGTLFPSSIPNSGRERSLQSVKEVFDLK